MPRNRRWRATLDGTVAEALSRRPVPPELLDRCIALAIQCDTADAREVEHAVDHLLSLAGHAWQTQGAEFGERPVVAAMTIAVDAYSATGRPQIVRGLANLLVDQGLAGLALALYDRALETKPRGPDREQVPAVAVLQNGRGNLLRELGELAEAERSLTAALAAIEHVPEKARALRSAALNNLGLVRLANGDHAGARDCLIASLELAEQTGSPPAELATTIDNLGHAELGLARDAGSLWMTEGFVNSVVAEHLANAEGYFARAQELFEAHLPGTSADLAISLVNSADIALEWADYVRAEQVAARAVEIAQHQGVSLNVSSIALAAQAEALLGLGNETAVVELLTPWFEKVAPTLAAHELPPRALTTLLRAAARRGDGRLVERVSRTLIEIDDELLRRMLAGAGEAEAAHIFHEYAHRAALIFGNYMEIASDATIPTWLYDLQLSRKGILSERYGSAWLEAVAFDSGVSPSVLAEVRELRAAAARIDLEGSGSEAIQEARRQYASAVSRLSRAEAGLLRELGPERSAPPRVASGDVQASLDSATVLLDITMTEQPDGASHYAMVMVRSDGPLVFRDLGPRATADEQLEGLLALLATRRNGDSDDHARTDVLSAVASLLFRSEDVLERRIVFAAAGLWGRIPLGLLPDPSGIALFERHVVALIPSARWLCRPAPVDMPAGAAVVMGDPDFDLGAGDEISFLMSMRLGRLAHAVKEMDEVARRLGTEPVTASNATRDRLLSVERPRILHVATHGAFLDAIASMAEMSEPRSSMLHNVAGAVVVDDSDGLGWTKGAGAPVTARDVHRRRVEWLRTIGPVGPISRSAIVLAGFNRWLAGLDTAPEVGTGIVSAGELALLDLAGTELVVLSACETGVGAVSYVDGTLIGLRSAALAAGAASCVASLWKVDDQATADLMSMFYQELAGGLEPSAALRAAQLQARDRRADPYYWAGWVAEGTAGSDGEPLDGRPGRPR